MTDQTLRDIYKLKNIIRYNTRLRLKDESVAEHSFYVALLSLMICDKYNVSNEITKNTVIKALLHDMPEIETNDITHDAKERLNLRPLLKTYEDDYYKRNFPKHCDLMNTTDKIVTTIVDLADSMSVKQYAMSEIELGHHDSEMHDILDDANMRIAKYTFELERLL